MEIINSKWILIIGIPLVIIIVLYFLGNKSVHTEIKINATPEQIWKVLMNKDQYREWNTVLIPVKGNLNVGETVEYEFHQDSENQSIIPSKVLKIETNRLLNQGGGIPGILTYNHCYIIDQTESGSKLTIHEDYKGIGVPFWNPSPVQRAYERLCHNLKDRVESLNK
ncbi:SRPBCC domain-containing protein [Flammeovirga agarivorans]|uniref:SRPBCC domain-containing protein n=1 Tax=Flammeovirga agarivorans TaxID=2726742 RepID=A0A7X8XVQ5_9BACT|nr:SRPBCC domain-containing protein [Flammeovirga agarivorans]NLR91489.1 SRPBCC domain-containing protein [Flammeovirga agarivorans]